MVMYYDTLMFSCREIAMEILSYQPEGGFIVRRSNSNPGCYALSLKAPQGIVHYLIENIPPSGYRIQVFVCVSIP